MRQFIPRKSSDKMITIKKNPNFVKTLSTDNSQVSIKGTLAMDAAKDERNASAILVSKPNNWFSRCNTHFTQTLKTKLPESAKFAFITNSKHQKWKLLSGVFPQNPLSKSSKLDQDVVPQSEHQTISEKHVTHPQTVDHNDNQSEELPNQPAKGISSNDKRSLFTIISKPEQSKPVSTEFRKSRIQNYFVQELNGVDSNETCNLQNQLRSLEVPKTTTSTKQILEEMLQDLYKLKEEETNLKSKISFRNYLESQQGYAAQYRAALTSNNEREASRLKSLKQRSSILDQQRDIQLGAMDRLAIEKIRKQQKRDDILKKQRLYEDLLPELPKLQSDISDLRMKLKEKHNELAMMRARKIGKNEEELRQKELENLFSSEEFHKQMSESNDTEIISLLNDIKHLKELISNPTHSNK